MHDPYLFRIGLLQHNSPARNNNNLEGALSVELALSPRVAAEFRSRRTGLWLAVALVLMIIVALLALWIISSTGGKPMGEELLRRLTNDKGKLIELVVVSLAAFAHVGYFYLSARRERLILSDLGVRYVSPLPPAIQFLRPSWSLQWSQVRRVELKSNSLSPVPTLLTLVLDAGTVKRSLLPHAWIDPAQFQPRSWRDQWRLTKSGAAGLVSEVMNSPLLQFIQKLPGRRFEFPETQTVAPFALEKNRAALTVVVLFFLSIGYAFFDGLILGSETYAGDPLYGIYACGGLAAFWLAFISMRRAMVPKPESLVVAGMMAAAFGAALYPGLLRLNALTDMNGPIARDYRMEAPGTFVPLDSGFPALNFPERHREFWSQYPAGRQEKFVLRKGGLGFYQIDMAPVYDRIQEWYESGGDKRRTSGRK